MSGGGPLGPSVWAVSDGRAGNASQVRAILQALGETRRWMKIAHIDGAAHRNDPVTLSPRTPWTWLPADKWPLLKYSIPAGQRSVLEGPWPTVWIAAGRRTAPFTRAVRDLSGGKTMTIQILDPNIPTDNFDMLVAPTHDGVSGPNVIDTIGSPSYFAPDQIEDAGQSFADLADERAKSAIVIIGGDSKTHTFSESAAERLEGQLRALAGLGWRLRITTSRRTSAILPIRSAPVSGPARKTARTPISPGSPFPMSPSSLKIVPTCCQTRPGMACRCILPASKGVMTSLTACMTA